MKIFFITLLALLAAVSTEEIKDYTGYKTYRVFASNDDQLLVLNLLKQTTGFDFWTAPRIPGLPIDIMVRPDKIHFFETFLYYNKFNASVLINNVATTLPSPLQMAWRKMFTPINGRISFQRFERYDTITAYLQKLAQTHSNIVTLINLGKTYENRNLLGIKISSGGSGKPSIMIDGGIHAREWIAPATVLYIINQLVENPAMASMYANVDWYIVPVLNPDGYEYTHTTDRFWRKNRSKGVRCTGTDQNRNWGFHWMEVGASDDECDETYAGKAPFSEIENVNLKNFAEANKNNMQLYLTFHSCGQYLLYPWGWTSSYPSNHAELQTLAENVNGAISSVRGTEYTIGSSTNVLYPAAGGSDDWFKGVNGVPLSYTIELPCGGSGGFNPPPSAIQGIVEETFEGVKVYHKYVESKA